MLGHKVIINLKASQIPRAVLVLSHVFYTSDVYAQFNFSHFNILMCVFHFLNCST